VTNTVRCIELWDNYCSQSLSTLYLHPLHCTGVFRSRHVRMATARLGHEALREAAEVYVAEVYRASQ
jgi:hypothetical protein